MKKIKYLLTISILLVTASLSITSCKDPNAPSIEQMIVDEAVKSFNLDLTIPEGDEIQFYKALPPTAAINGTVVNITWEKESEDPFIELSNNVLTANRNIVTVSSNLKATIEYKGIKGVKTFDVSIPPIKTFNITSEFQSNSVKFIDNKLIILDAEDPTFNQSFDIQSIDSTNNRILLKDKLNGNPITYPYKYSISAQKNMPSIDLISEYNETSWWKSKGYFSNKEKDIDLNVEHKSLYIDRKYITISSFDETFTSFTTDNGEIWDIADLKNEKALTITKKGSKLSVSYKLVFTPIDFFEDTLTT